MTFATTIVDESHGSELVVHRPEVAPVCLPPENPNRLVSLLELLTFSAHVLIDRMSCLGFNALVRHFDISTPDKRAEIIEDLKLIRESCAGLELSDCSEKVTRIIEAVEKRFDQPDAVAALCDTLHDDIESALQR